MNLTNEIRSKMVEAMKSGDKDSKAVYSDILNALKNKAKNIGVTELNTEQEVEVISKLAKENQESIDTCPSDRFDILNKLRFEKQILNAYLPKQMDKNEIIEVIKVIINELSLNEGEITAKDKGKIMKALMPRVKGKADGTLVNNILTTFFIK